MLVLGTYEGGLVGFDLIETEDSIELNQVFGYMPHTGSIKCMTASGSILATGGSDEMIHLYDLKKKKECGGLLVHDSSVTALTLNGQMLLSGSVDGKLIVSEMKAKNSFSVKLQIQAHKESITSIALHASNKLAITVSSDNTCKIWDLTRGTSAQIQQIPVLPIAGGTVKQSPIEIKMSDERICILYSNALYFLNLSGPNEEDVQIFQGSFTCCCFIGPNLLVVGTPKGSIAIISLEGDAKLVKEIPTASKSRIKSVIPFELGYASVCSEGIVTIWTSDFESVADFETQAGRVTAMTAI
jgi:protein MAK11